jgi:hypothetical protein
MRLSRINRDSRIIVIIEGLKRLLNQDGIICEDNPEDEYFKNPELREWLASHGIEVSEIPQSKRGSEGIVYFFGDKVVKISGDKTEAAIASKVKGNHDITAVIDLVPVGDKFAILQHVVEFRPRHPTVEALDYLMAYFDDTSKEVLLQPTEEIIKGLYSNFPEAEGAVDLEGAINLLKMLYDATGFIHDDAAPSNVGLLNSKVVFTDLGPNRIA